VDAVFRAMADAGRRALLDALFERDGRSLSELCMVLPDLTRFGVMKHLGVLEAAHLVTTNRIGREKLHYLNPVPIREVHDRWVSKFAEPWAAAMVDLRKNLEGDQPWSAPVTSSRRTSARHPTRSGKR
jgi:DNA-binding transcriptional ArsR family regulator